MASAAGGGTGVGAAGADELAAAPAVFSIANGSDHAEGALPVQPVVTGHSDGASGDGGSCSCSAE